MEKSKSLQQWNMANYFKCDAVTDITNCNGIMMASYKYWLHKLMLFQGMYYGFNCERANLCLSNPCKNGATCHNTSSYGYRCQCTTGYYGANCETYNPCSKARCDNGAKCLNISATEYKCLCEQPYYGEFCQHFNRWANTVIKGTFYPCSTLTTVSRNIQLSLVFGFGIKRVLGLGLHIYLRFMHTWRRMNTWSFKTLHTFSAFICRIDL